MPRTPAANSYAQLLKSIQNQITESKRVIERQTVVTYWNVGRGIEFYIQKHGSAGELYERLSADTGVHVRTLQQCVQFVQTFPDFDARLPLSWSHYRFLMRLDSSTERERWMKRVIKENLSTLDLDRLISVAKAKQLPTAAADEPVRGMLYTYRIVKVSYTQKAAGGFMVDMGFEVRHVPPPSAGTIDNTRVVESVKTGSGYRLVLSKADTSKIYTYQAIVERIIDGDTLLVNIDQGFDCWIRQRLRLRGIDAPERRTKAGEAAFAFVQEELKSCPFIVIKTYKSDKYDRYLTDVFYTKGATDPAAIAATGTCLNTELLKNGFAAIWEK